MAKKTDTKTTTSKEEWELPPGFTTWISDQGVMFARWLPEVYLGKKFDRKNPKHQEILFKNFIVPRCSHPNEENLSEEKKVQLDALQWLAAVEEEPLKRYPMSAIAKVSCKETYWMIDVINKKMGWDQPKVKATSKGA